MDYLRMLFDLYQLKKQTKFSKKQMRKLQERKLRKLLHHAWNYSSYYSKAFQEAGITAEQLDTLALSAFPTINKNILLTQFQELVTVPGLTQEEIREFDEKDSPGNMGDNSSRKPYLDKYHVVHSSGSTGKPGYFVYDKEAWHSMLLGIIRAALWDMNMLQVLALLSKKPHIAYLAATDGRYGGAMAVGDGIEGVGAKQLYLDIKTPLDEWCARLEEFRPDIVIGYPSAVKILAELMEAGGVSLKVSRVITCGEPLGAGIRNYLEKIFAASVINFYGASESLALGVETDVKEGMLLFDDMNIIEVENGAMYITSLYNFVQPLIRYQLSDNLSLQEAAENAACPFTRATGLLGRKEDILWFEDGRGHREFLHPLAIEGFCIEGLRDYQFRQLSKDAFEMYAEVSQKASREKIRKEILGQMKIILNEKGLAYVQFYINFVEEILPDPATGKKPLIIVQTNRREKKCV